MCEKIYTSVLNLYNIKVNNYYLSTDLKLNYFKIFTYKLYCIFKK